jgi:hypothetical protein
MHPPPQACRHQPVATSLSLAPQPGAINCKEPKSKIKKQKSNSKKQKPKTKPTLSKLQCCGPRRFEPVLMAIPY